METAGKEQLLRQILSAMDRVAVAYSGGVDSTYLLKIAYDTLGERTAALTAVSASLPADELSEAQHIARQIGVKHVLIESHEMEDPLYLANSSARCFFCKDQVYTELIDYARNYGYDWVVDGSNLDDAGDHRPGRQAAHEHGVRSPLLEAELTKAEIRQLAREAGLPNWDKPAAACLSSRIPYGTVITLEALSQVERAERYLRSLGVRQVRVRHYQDSARIEVDLPNLEVVLTHRETVLRELKSLGYTYVTLDLEGFRSGSLNEVLKPNGRYKNRETA